MALESYDQSIYNVKNDPEDFKMPYQVYGELEEEILKWQYFRLNNKDSFHTKRCFGILFNTLNQEF